MTYQIRRLGWLPDPLDHRDCDLRQPGVRARLNQAVPVLSRGVKSAGKSPVGEIRVDLREWCSPIENQGDIGSCTAHAVVGALEYFERKTRGQHVDASRRFLYRVTRRYLGWEGKGDTGAFLRSAIKSLRIFGVVPEQFWPYDEARYDDEPEGFHYAYAQNFKALEYFRVPENPHDLQQVLLAGLPFVFGFTCFSSIDDDAVGETGIIPYPRRNERDVGGHAVMAVGFTDSHIIIRNSWGKGWGDKGYGYLPWSYFDSAKPLADDCWVLVNAAWMPDDEGEAFPEAFVAKAARAARAPRGAAPRAAKPSAPATHEEERHDPQIKVTRGRDPLRALPLRLDAADRRAELAAEAAAEVPLAETRQRVSLYLRDLKLLKSFDWALFGEATNELYLMGVCWDLSGAEPVVFPPKQLEGAELRTYNLEKGETVRFVGDGIQLWPARPIKGGLYVRLVVMESDEDVRRLGRSIAEVHQAVKESALTSALGALATAAGVSAPALAAVGAAADLLTTVVANALQKNGDDLVALFDGSYGAENVFASRRERYAQGGADIELDFIVGGAAPGEAPKRAPAKRRTGKTK